MTVLGNVICDEESPTQSSFSFVITGEGSSVKQGQFVHLQTEEGKVIGMIVNLLKTNRYFEHVEAVKVYSQKMQTIYPTTQWECLVAKVQILGVQNGDSLDRVCYPPSPGQPVYKMDGEALCEFLGFNPNGIEIGQLKHHGVPVKLDLTRLFQKHVAILAQSGAGKSYCARTIIEQLLKRKQGCGRPAAIVVDVHGEYRDLAEIPEFSESVTVVRGDKMKIGVPNLSAYHFREFVPEMSEVQARELHRVITELRRREEGVYGIEELIWAVENSDIHSNVKLPLLAWLSDLQSMELFAPFDDPALENSLFPGSLVVLDLEPVTNLRKKQILVAYALQRLFNLRKQNRIPPFVFFLEEAHQFAPEESAISRRTIETLAREGRKFSASLVVISQRPKRLCTTVLSQAGTNIILRITNPYDLDHLKRSSEAITSHVADAISSLPTGEALIVGEAVNFPIFVRIKTPEHPPKRGKTFEDAAREFESKQKQTVMDAITLMDW